MAQLPEAGKSGTMSKLTKMGLPQQDGLLVPRKPVSRGLRRIASAHDLHGNLEILPGLITAAEATSGRVKPLLRLWLKSPWEDYQSIKISSGLMVAGRKGSYFKMATIRSYVCLEALKI